MRWVSCGEKTILKLSTLPSMKHKKMLEQLQCQLMHEKQAKTDGMCLF